MLWKTKALSCFLLVLLLVGTARKTASEVGTRSLGATSRDERRQELSGELRKGIVLLHDARYSDAQIQLEKTYAAALGAGYPDIAARAQGKAGGCQFALRQYRPALRSFLAARLLAQSAGDASSAAALDLNIASLYSEMGDVESAAQWMTGKLDSLSGADRAEMLPKFLIQMATLRARQDRMSEALDLFRQGIAAADKA